MGGLIPIQGIRVIERFIKRQCRGVDGASLSGDLRHLRPRVMRTRHVFRRVVGSHGLRRFGLNKDRGIDRGLSGRGLQENAQIPKVAMLDRVANGRKDTIL